MGDRFYKAVRLLGAPLAYRCVGLEEIVEGRPAVYVANHLGSIGPAEVIISVPARFYPWAIAEMTDPDRAAAYLHEDFVRPAWRLHGGLGMAVSTVVSRLAVTLINGLDAVPVDRNRRMYLSHFRRSLELLQQGKPVLIFPEDTQGPQDPETRMRPFLAGFVHLCALYQRVTGEQLPVYPIAVSQSRKTIAIGQAVYLDLLHAGRGEIRSACQHVQEIIRSLLQTLQG